jgi:branched-chain amino acid transport system ATP-binding protein
MHTLVRNLSYGMQRQIEVIMALACDAKLLLLDEATAGLPPGDISTLSSMILKLDPKITLLIIEHDMNVAFQLAHRMIVLQNGRVIAEGPPEKIKVDSKVQEIYLGEEEVENA